MNKREPEPLRSIWLGMSVVGSTALMIFILFIPVVPTSHYQTCGPAGCTNVTQYESVAYHYGGWGALFQTGVNWYAVDGWRCSCPINATNCCVAPYGSVILGVLIMLSVIDLVSVALLVRGMKRVSIQESGSRFNLSKDAFFLHPSAGSGTACAYSSTAPPKTSPRLTSESMKPFRNQPA
jgi:hypothetical protein